MTDQHDDLYEFGPFSLSPHAPVLFQAGRPVTLQPKVFELLRLLLENSGRILDKDKLMEQLWPDCVVEESSLTQLVFQLRKALGESGARQQYIETVPRRGYRFIGEVRLTRPGESEIRLTSHTGMHIAPAPAAEIVQPLARSASRNTRKAWLALAVLLLVSAAAIGGWRLFKQMRTVAAFSKLTQRKLTASGGRFSPPSRPTANGSPAFIVKSRKSRSRSHSFPLRAANRSRFLSRCRSRIGPSLNGRRMAGRWPISPRAKGFPISGRSPLTAVRRNS